MKKKVLLAVLMAIAVLVIYLFGFCPFHILAADSEQIWPEIALRLLIFSVFYCFLSRFLNEKINFFRVFLLLLVQILGIDLLGGLLVTLSGSLGNVVENSLTLLHWFLIWEVLTYRRREPDRKGLMILCGVMAAAFAGVLIFDLREWALVKELPWNFSDITDYLALKEAADRSRAGFELRNMLLNLICGVGFSLIHKNKGFE
ncbi:MAG: hypothetical protein IJ043_11085 [Clostridia bacterium]|nr:hypothetical protein [Clostridia bacterium]